VSDALANRFNRMWELVRQVPHSTYAPKVKNAPKQVQAPEVCRLDCVRCGMESELFLLTHPPPPEPSGEPLPEISDKDGWLYDPDAKLAEVRAKMQPLEPSGEPADNPSPSVYSPEVLDEIAKQPQQPAETDWAKKEAQEWILKEPGGRTHYREIDVESLTALLRRVVEERGGKS